MRRLSFFVVFLLIFGTTAAWSQYRIEGSLKGGTVGIYTLAHYFGSSQYIQKATAVMDSSGRVVFEGQTSLPEGLYMLLSPRKQRIADFVVDSDQDFAFTTDTVNISEKMKIEGSRENELFYEYQRKVLDVNTMVSLYQNQLRFGTDEAGKKMLQTKILNARRDLKNQFDDFVKANQGTLVAKWLQASSEVQFPSASIGPNGKADSTWLFQYYQQHFFDNIDFGDERIVRTPFYQRKLDRYFKEVILPDPDSLVKAHDWLIAKALDGKQKELIAYTIWYLTNQAEASYIVGNESVFIHLAEKYYLGGLMPIVDSTTLQTIREKVTILKPLLVGKTMPALMLTDTAGVSRPLSEVKSNYTVVIFYEPTCSHCRQAMPSVKQFYDKYKDSLGVKVYAVALGGSPDNWKSFIKEFKIGDWTHGYDYTFRINYRKDFDVVNAPTIYLLDANKKIIARRLPAEQLESFIDFYEHKQKR